MKVKQLFLGGLLLSGIVFASCEKTDNDKLNDQDQDFLTKASISNTAEIGAATIAVSKATNTAVKAYAQNMIAEHNLAQSDLKKVGSNVGVVVKDTLDPAHVVLAAQLNSLSGRAFDSTYIYSQVGDHQTTVKTFQTEQTNGRHKDVLNFASTYLPHIQMHLMSADSISKAYFKRP